MSITSCAEIVEKGDPDRFLAVMAAPVELRAKLWPLYAFNVEVARAPWVTEETAIAEIRLQWWRDAVAEIAAGGPVRRHEVVEPLAECVRGAALDTALLDQSIAARRWDIYRDPFEDADHLREYIGKTAGNMMLLGARAIGSDAPESPLRDVGFALGMANWLMAVPELEARGRKPLVDGRPEAVSDLAQEALDRLKQVDRRPLFSATPIVRTAWRAKGILQQAVRDPLAVAEGRLGGAEFSRRAGLFWRVLRGSW